MDRRARGSQRDMRKWQRGLSGQLVDKKYRLGKFVGAGRIGYVYYAERDDASDAPCAVKLVFDTLKPGWETEITKVTKLRTIEGVVQFHDLGTDTITSSGVSKLVQYTVWDYISPGRNLKSYLADRGNVAVSFLMAVVQQILRVLYACLERGVARHGDLHAGNILIGDDTLGRLDDTLRPRQPIFVSDFGYGATEAVQQPKDDYQGLSRIFDQILAHVDRVTASATDRQIIQESSNVLHKLLRDTGSGERQPPIRLLEALYQIQHDAKRSSVASGIEVGSRFGHPVDSVESPNVGQFQVSELIGDRWEWWKRLFVPTVPARSKILSLDIPTVLTGPRGSGKTMLLRRLSERVVVECGEVESLSGGFAAFYVSANDFADPFASFSDEPDVNESRRLTCYANLCVLSDVLAVQAAYNAGGRVPATQFMEHVRGWLVKESGSTLIVEEDPLESYRSALEEIKWRFPASERDVPFPGWDYLSQYRWLPYFCSLIGKSCSWLGGRPILIFIDDYSTPRVSSSMQRVLNRLFLQRSPAFLAKVATESASTFVPEDSSRKNLEDGDDYWLVDIGEESLFLPETERTAFLNEVFSRRLAYDRRIPAGDRSLYSLLGRTGLSKTEFARQLRASPDATTPVNAASQRRGRSRARVLYWGEDVFSGLWSGDTRTMIQLIAGVVDQSASAGASRAGSEHISLPIESSRQDTVFRNRGGEWLSSHERNAPTEPTEVRRLLEEIRADTPDFSLCGQYGQHLKAIVESFVYAARQLLLGPMYQVRDATSSRRVPRMAFRIEVVDEFRLDGLAQELYRDLIRYGLFIRDSRGKSVRGAFVPRLFLRRLLIPYCALALSKRDSVQLTCAQFNSLLLTPDKFRDHITRGRPDADQIAHLQLPLFDDPVGDVAPDYNDLLPGE